MAICIYIEGTKKIYKKFDIEAEANEFLALWDKHQGQEGFETTFELGTCEAKARFLWSCPIQWEAINDIRLNDFEAYEQLLFSEDERNLFNRWEKFIKRDIEITGLSEPEIGVYMPFIEPKTVKEFHLNHYVYWMAIGYLEMDSKPLYFFDYNTGKKMLSDPIHFCWACEYSHHIYKLKSQHETFISFDCDFCPLWNEAYGCEEEEGSPYLGWLSDGEPKEAFELAKKEWHNFDYLTEKYV